MKDCSFVLEVAAPIRQGRLVHGPRATLTPALAVRAPAGAVLGLGPEELHTIGIGVVIVDIPRLMLRPGIAAIRKVGGAAGLLHWDGMLIGDGNPRQGAAMAPLEAPGHRRLRQRGQTASPRRSVRVTPEAVHFASPFDGAPCVLTPEAAVQQALALGVDLAFTLDPSRFSRTGRPANTCQLSRAWDLRAAQAVANEPLGLVASGPAWKGNEPEVMSFRGFGFAQPDAATEAHKLQPRLAALPEPALRAIAGDLDLSLLPVLLAAGFDLIEASAAITHSRVGRAYVDESLISLFDEQFARAFSPLDPTCGCYTCQHFSRAYLHHLFVAEELLAYRLLAIHNLSCWQRQLTNLVGR